MNENKEGDFRWQTFSILWRKQFWSKDKTIFVQLSLKLLRVKAQLENRLKTSNEHVQRQNANVSQQLELDQVEK